ncbi:MAG: VaFE repeat-containing surface-anchored protein [Clostridiales bacterium]|nr:VaFE repeat-containing surface-anchored protein [Clostridiales bacterium]
MIKVKSNPAETRQMQRMRVIRKLISRLVCFMFIATSLVVIGGYKADKAYAASAKVVSVKALQAGSSTEHIGKISGMSGFSYCMDTGRTYPKKGTTGNLSKIKTSSPANERNVAKLLYYYAHLQSDKYTKNAEDVRILRLAMHLAYHNGDRWTKWPHLSEITDKESNEAHKVYKDAKAQPFPTEENFEAFIYSPNKTSSTLNYQRLATYNISPIEPGDAELIKELSDDGIKDEDGNLCGETEGFKFKFSKKDDTQTSYTAKTDSEGRLEIKGMRPGVYIVNELLTDEQKESYESLTIDKEIEIIENETTYITWTNRYRPLVGLNIIKTVNDEGSVAGFRFTVKGHLFNHRKLTEEELIHRLDPQVECKTDELSIGEWTVDAEDLKALNTAAKNGETGEYFVRMNNILIHNNEDIETEEAETEYNEAENPEEKDNSDTDILGKRSEQVITISAKIRLKTNSEREIESEPERIEYDEDLYKIEINTFDFLGAAGVFEDEFVTDETGNKSYTNLSAGEYTVTEKMTDSQSKMYRQPESQTVILTDTNRDAVFNFENKARRTPIKLKKEYPGQSIADIKFKLSGKTDFGIDLELIKGTDENGVIDFGMLYAGTYRIEEIGYNSSHMINMYKAQESEHPSFEFRITGDENAIMWLGGPKNAGGASIEEVTFLNQERPRIETVLLDRKNDNHNTTVSKETELYDTVKFQNLIPGEEYTLTGRLVCKAKGKPMTDKGKEILSVIKFTPEMAEDTVENKFRFNSLALGEEAVVAYEELSKDGEILAVHADINNEEQTVRFNDVPRKIHGPATGDKLPKLPFIGLGLCLMSCIALIVIKQRRR